MNILAQAADPLDSLMHALLWKAVPVILLCGIIGMVLGDLRKGAEKWLERTVRRLVHGRDQHESNAHHRSSPSPKPAAPHCPTCNAPMVARQSKRGAQVGKRFWGCSTYPACRGTRPVLPTEAAA